MTVVDLHEQGDGEHLDFANPPGPDGYLVIAQHEPWFGGRAFLEERGIGEGDQRYDWAPTDEWTAEHFAMFHGWSELKIARAKVERGNKAEKAHWDEHKTRAEIPLPHTHWFGLDYAISTSHLHRTYKLAILAMLAGLGDARTEGDPPPDSLWAYDGD